MNVRTVDLKAKTAAQEIAQSLRETGFVVLSNTGVSESLVSHVYSDWAWFFDSEEKHGYLFDTQTHAGFFPYKSENAKYSDIKDLKEFYHHFEDSQLPEGICEKTNVAFENLFELGLRLLMMIETELPEEVHDKLSEPLMAMVLGGQKTLFRILHYPPVEGSEEGVRSAAHEDINLITLLPAATQTGLQVQDNEGNWHAIQTKPGEIVVNVGDMLQEATGGYFKSTTHRVVNPSGEDAKQSRYSMPMFVHPRGDVRLSDRYTAEEYLNERLKEIGLK